MYSPCDLDDKNNTSSPVSTCSSISKRLNKSSSFSLSNSLNQMVHDIEITASNKNAAALQPLISSDPRYSKFWHETQLHKTQSLKHWRDLHPNSPVPHRIAHTLHEADEIGCSPGSVYNPDFTKTAPRAPSTKLAKEKRMPDNFVVCRYSPGPIYSLESGLSKQSCKFQTEKRFTSGVYATDLSHPSVTSYTPQWEKLRKSAPGVKMMCPISEGSTVLNLRKSKKTPKPNQQKKENDVGHACLGVKKKLPVRVCTFGEPHHPPGSNIHVTPGPGAYNLLNDRGKSFKVAFGGSSRDLSTIPIINEVPVGYYTPKFEPITAHSSSPLIYLTS